MKLTKLLAAVCTSALTIALAVVASAADPVVFWDFGNADDTTLYKEDGTVAFGTNNVIAVFDETDSTLKADVTGGDPYLQIPSRGEFPAENCYMRVKYYLSGITDWATSVYFTTDTVSWSETGHYKGFYDGDDDEWCEMTFVMTECDAWAGTIKDIRLDVFDNAYEGQLAKIAYVAVFASEEDANNFNYEEYRKTAPVPQAEKAEETETESGTYLTLTTVKDAEVIDDDTTQDLGGSGNPIQIMDAYGCGYSSLGDMVVFNDVDFGANGASSARMHFGYGADDGTVTTLAFYIDNPDGTPALETEVGFTGGWDITSSGWVDLDLAVPAGIHTIYMEFTNEKSGSLSELTFVEAAPAPAEEAPAEEAPAEETPAEPAPAEEPAAEEAPVVTEAPAVETVTAPVEEVQEAAQTFDFGVLAAVAAIVSAAGYALAKKK